MINKLVDEFVFKPIGYLESSYPEKFGTPRQSGIVAKANSKLEILPEFQPEISLQGLEGYSHVWLQFVFHLNTSNRFHAKVHPPRLEGKSMGLFATRSPHRPNPIGLSLVELVEVGTNFLIFAGADIVSGTPILDVKPYLPQYESLTGARGGWTAEVGEPQISVEFSLDAEKKLQSWITKVGRPELKEVIEQILKQDPRPVVYRGFEEVNSPYRDQHAFRLYEGDVHFRFTSATHVIVFDILI